MAGSHKIEFEDSKKFRILFSLFIFLEKTISTFFSRKFQERSVWVGGVALCAGTRSDSTGSSGRLAGSAFLCSHSYLFFCSFLCSRAFFFVLFLDSPPPATSRPQFSKLASPDFRVLRLFRCALKLRILPCKIRNGLISYTELLLCTKEDGLQSKRPRPRDHDVVFCCVLLALTIFVVVFVSAVSFRN